MRKAAVFLCLAAGQALGNTTFISRLAIKVTPPEDHFVCITNYDSDVYAITYTAVICENGIDSELGIGVDSYDAVASPGNCIPQSMLGAISSDPLAYFTGSHFKQDCNGKKPKAVVVPFFAGGDFTVLLDVLGEPTTDCRCPILNHLIEGKASVSFAYEFRPNTGGGGPGTGGSVTLTGNADLPPAPSAGDGRRVTFYPLTGCNDKLNYTQTLSGDCGNGIDGFGNINFTTQCTGGGTVGVGTAISFSDAQLDADGNGRFNERDWPLIQAILGSMAASDIAKYNFVIDPDLDMDGDVLDDQVITQEDLDVIRSLLDAGCDAGELGDLNGDDIVDCTDYAMLPASLNATICDAIYKVTLDADLDGDNDAADLAAVQALFPTADVAAPFGILDLSDISTLIAAFTAQTPPADFAPPFGTYDLADLTAFVSAFDTPCP